MFEVLGSIFWLLVTLGVLITFHEFGHFWVARRLGVRVLRFSVGFGRPLWTRQGADGTEYVIAAIPLGGYVKFLDENESTVAPAEADRAFNRKPVLSRIAIVAAGPIFNLIFAVAAFWLMFVVGKGDFLPIVGRSTGVAAVAGVAAGDRLLSVDGEHVATWTDASMLLVKATLDRRPIALEVLDRGGSSRTRHLDLSRLPASIDETRALSEIGMVPNHVLLAPVIGRVAEDTAAAAAGLQKGDRLLRINGESIAYWDELTPAVQRHAKNGAALELVLERATERLTVRVKPRMTQREDGTSAWVLGLEPQQTLPQYDTLLRYGPLDAVPMALSETWRLSRETLAILKRMVLGSASLKNISGPISIAQYANMSAQLGVAWYLFFLAVLSLSIAIMNLLPIPILDGGHLLYYLIELVKGSPVSERLVAAGQYVGVALLASLMGLAFYNDILRLVP